MNLTKQEYNIFFQKSILVFFFFLLLFPTFRISVIGSETYHNFYQLLVSALPEIFMAGIGVLLILGLKWVSDLSFKTIDWLVLGYVVVNVVYGTWLAHDLKLSLYAVRLTYLPMIFYFFARVGLNKNNFNEERFITKIIYGVVAFAIIGVVLYFFLPDFSIDMICRSGGEVNQYFIPRMTSIVWTPVVFSTIVAIGGLFYFYRTLKNLTILNYTLCILCWMCVLLSMSRGALIALLFCTIIMSLLARKWKSSLLLFGGFAIVFVTVAIYIGTPIEYFKWLGTSSVSTVSMNKGETRVKFWKSAEFAFFENPMGNGLGTSGHIGARFLRGNEDDLSSFSTDGWYLKLLDETGVVGLISFVIMGGYMAILLLRKIIKNSFSFFTFLFVFCIMIHVQNLVSNVFDFFWVANFYWMMAGLTINEIYTENRQ